MEKEVTYVTFGRSRTTIHIPSCLASDAVETPLGSLLMEENKQTPTENRPKDKTPKKTQKRSGTTSKRKLDLQCESLSTSKTPECKPHIFRKLQSYWEQKSIDQPDVKSKGIKNDRIVLVDSNHCKSPSITPKKQCSSLVKEYTQIVTNISNNSPEKICHIDNDYLDDSDVWVFTPRTPASCDQTGMGPPSSMSDVILSARKSRNRTPRSMGRSKSVGDISSSDSGYSADDLTPKRPQKIKSPRQPRRLLSTNPSVYSQLISPPSSVIEAEGAPVTKVSQQLQQESNVPINVTDDLWTDSNSIETNRESNTSTTSNRKISLETVSIADLSEIRPIDNCSIREFNDSTFIGDITFDLKNISTSIDTSVLNQTENPRTPILSDDVKNLIHDIVCGFVDPEPSTSTDPDDGSDERTEGNEKSSDKTQSPESEEIRDSSSETIDHNYKILNLDSPGRNADIPGNNRVKPDADAIECDVEPVPSIDTLRHNVPLEEEIVKPISANPTSLELSIFQSPNLSLHEQPYQRSSRNSNRDCSWSPTLSDPVADKYGEPCVLNRRNIKRPRKLVLQPNDQPAAQEEYEPSPKHAKTPVSIEKFSFEDQTDKENSQPELMTYVHPYSPYPDDNLDSSINSCDTDESSYLDTSVDTETSDSDFCYSPPAKTELQAKLTSLSLQTAGYSPPLIRSPYTRFSSPSYSTDGNRSPRTPNPSSRDWSSPAPHLTRLSCGWSDSEDSVDRLDGSYFSFQWDLRAVEDLDSPSDESPDRVDFCPVVENPDLTQPAPVVSEAEANANQNCGISNIPAYNDAVDPRVAVLSRNDSSCWTEFTAGHVTYTATPSFEANQYALNCYNSITETNPWFPAEDNRSRTEMACMYQRPMTETYILPDSLFNSTVTIQTDRRVDTQPSTNPVIHTSAVPSPIKLNCSVQTSVNINEPVRTVLPSYNLPSATTSYDFPTTPCVQFDDTNSGPESNNQGNEKRSGGSGLFGMMAQSIKKKLANKVKKYFDSSSAPEAESYDLLDSLKNIRPYIISGYLSSTYLISLVKKQDLFNDMFDEAIDENGNIHQWVVDSCRKNTAAIFARDLVFRVFTLGELINLNMLKLDRKKMAAIRNCVKEQFPTMTKWSWRSKCVSLIKSSVSTLFKHRVKQVQMFFLMHSG